MSGLTFDAKTLKRRLSKLPPRHGLTFGVWLLERMLPNFVKFSAETQSEGVSILDEVVTYAWSVIETGDKDPLRAPPVALCETIAPDTENFESIYTSSALDAAVAACNLLIFIETSNVDLVVEMAGLARDSVDLFIQFSGYVETNGRDLEDKVRNHPLMQLELSRQETDLAHLERWPLDNGAFLGAALARKSVEQDQLAIGDPQ
ncbi:MAG: hypothetical protein CFE27_07205 [Alphaproteobacteria bacterium PA1]|nr:MAG: hypothetical protein CFE27_07205 [Alphaproteobacteria bacterium PA1]